jgi:uncharacterized membrane protein YeaQ/YmgE (transglycosylase-associated protein family)
LKAIMQRNAALRHPPMELCRNAKNKPKFTNIASFQFVSMPSCYRDRTTSEEAPMRSLLLLLGLPYMPASQLVVFMGFAGLLLVLLGWIADAIMRENGFGVLLNGALLLAGAVLGTLLWQHLGYAGAPSLSLTAAIVAGGSGIILLIGCGAGKRFV